MSRAWVFQEPEDVRKVGEGQAPWQVRWREPGGRQRKRSFGPGARGKRLADQFRRKVEAELMTGTYNCHDRKTWEEFRAEYERRVAAGLAPQTRDQVKAALDHFQRIARPARMFTIDTGTIDEFVARRRRERGKKRGELVSPATVNKDLRHIKAALSAAVDWGYLRALPRFRMERVPRLLPRYVTDEHFLAVYDACEGARKPAGLPYPPADWWRALLVFARMTGWRVGEILALRRADLDLGAGRAVTRAADNKGKRDEAVRLDPLAVEHLRRLGGFSPRVFPWPHDRRTLDAEFDRIQRAAGIDLPCPKRHEHTAACHTYGFHDLRRAFATMNAGVLSAEQLRAMMRHRSYSTTQVYINLARQLEESAPPLHAPEGLRGRAAGGGA